MHNSVSPKVSRLGLVILVLTISVGPFFQGYFFPTSTLLAMLAVACAFGLWAIGKHAQRMALNLHYEWTDKLLLAFMVWCLVATAWSVYAHDHFTLVLKIATAFGAFAVARAENTVRVRGWVVWLLSLSALVVAILGLLEYSGFFMEHVALGEWLQIEPQRDRLYTVFQYPNSAAIFFLMVLLLQNGRLVAADSWVEKLALGSLSGIIATAFALTLSRGAVLVAPFGIIMLWLGLSGRQIFSSLLYWLASAVLPLALAVRPIAQGASGNAWPTVLLWALVATAVGTVATGLLQILFRMPAKVQVIAAVTAVSLLVAGGAIVAPQIMDNVPVVFARVAQMNAEDLTNNGRFEFLRDAVQLATRRPWGYGGGGWLRAYTQVQRYNYVARDPHSHYTLTMVETGIPGLVFLVAAIGSAAFHAFRSRRGDPVRWAMAAAALTLAGHAVMDLDLSYYALWLLLWTLLGAAQPELKPLPLKQEHRFTFPATLAAATTVLLVCGTLFAAAHSYAAAEEAVVTGDNQAALAAGTRAIRLDPLNSQYRTMIPTAGNISRALELDPQNEELWRFVSDLLEEQGDLNGALATAQRALELRPMSVSHYERVAGLQVRMMTAALEEGRTGEATAIARDVIALGQTMEVRGEPSLARQELLFPTYSPLTWTPHLNLAAGQAYFVAGDYKSAEAHLTSALASEETAAEAAFWLHVLHTLTGNAQGLAALEPKPSADALNSRLYGALLAIR